MWKMKSFPDLALLAIRLALGAIFIAHGSQKVLGIWGGHGLVATIQGFQQMGIPPALGAAAAFTEFLGGLALVVGLLSRLAGLGIIVVMVVAVWKVHWRNGFFLNPTAPGFEYNLALIAMALAVLLAGAGRISLDHLIAGVARRK